jgi:hypothetical protein
MNPQEIEAAAEAIWKKMNPDNKDWAAQPDDIKFLPRLYARAALEAVAKRLSGSENGERIGQEKDNGEHLLDEP